VKFVIYVFPESNFMLPFITPSPATTVDMNVSS